PALSLADETPNPALAACKAEYLQLGAAGFLAKYGSGDTALRACVEAHGGTTPTAPTAPTPPTGPEALCKAEYLRLGADGFAAKYGADALRACMNAHGATDKAGGAAANSLAARLCELEFKQSGADAFAAKYGAGDAA